MARVTMFLTADQRKWFKTTARTLPVDGLSASDVVRLAVTRLRRDLDGGLGLVEALSVQLTRRGDPEGRGAAPVARIQWPQDACQAERAAHRRQPHTGLPRPIGSVGSCTEPPRFSRTPRGW